MSSTCKCPSCGANLQLNVAYSGPQEEKSPPRKVPKFTDTDMGKLRKCLYDCGLEHDGKIFNDCGDVRQDGTQRRRLKIWAAEHMTVKQCEKLGLACERAFGEDLISAGRVVTKSFPMSESVSFCVHLWVIK